MINQFSKEKARAKNHIRLANATNGVCLEIVSSYYATIIIRKRSLKGFVLWEHRVQKGGKNFIWKKF